MTEVKAETRAEEAPEEKRGKPKSLRTTAPSHAKFRSTGKTAVWPLDPRRRPPGFGFTTLLLCGWCGATCAHRGRARLGTQNQKDPMAQNQARGH